MTPELRLEVAGNIHAADPTSETIIGRSPSCDVVVPGDSVSRVHATVRWTNHSWELSDADSAYGCFVEGHRIDRLELAAGRTEVRLGGPNGAGVVAYVAERGSSDQPNMPPAMPGSLVASQPMAPQLRIGRHPDNDMVLADLSVSRHHAVVRRVEEGWEVEDLRSSSGTYIDGRPVRTARLLEGQLLSLGRHILVMSDGQLVDHVDDTVSLIAREVSVDVSGQRILDRVSFAVDAGHLVAVVGPTGAGKSTLMKALAGYSEPSNGSVSYNGQDLHASLDQLRTRIGYVPQDDICHVQLKLREALLYAAELRFSADTEQDERLRRVDEVLAELGLAHRADLRVERLSGGQRKRGSIAMELLTRPALMFCDEPTSGLDPAYERSVTELLRDLADGGRTIVVTTHSMASLHLYDRVLCLAPGGRPAFYGPPAEALDYFGASGWPDVFYSLEHEQRDWTGELQAHPVGGRYVAEPLRRAARKSRASLPPARQAPSRQTWTLLRRSIAVALASRTYAFLLLAQAPVIGLILLGAIGRGQFAVSGGNRTAGTGPDSDKAMLLLALLVVATVTIGLVNGCREVVKERAVWQREHAVGLGVLPYLSSKAFLCIAIAIVQVPLLCLTAVLPQDAGAGVVVGSGTMELGIALLAVMITASALGLAISALARQEAVALVAVPVVVIAQLVLCGAFVKVEDRPVLEQIAWVTTSYWGLNATGSTVDILDLDPYCSRVTARPELDGGPAGAPSSPCPSRAEHTGSAWVSNMAGVLVLAPLLLGGAALVLIRRRSE